MRKSVMFLYMFFVPMVYAKASYNNIGNNVTLYSEYYPNTKSKFKGTIVFENGSGTNLGEWTKNKKLMQCLKRQGSIFLYDRSGLGLSKPDYSVSVKSPITASFIGDKFSKLITLQKVKPPYIIIAHSYGAIFASDFILKNPDLIKGVVLVDPVPRDYMFAKKVWNNFESGVNVAQNHSSAFMYKNFKGPYVEASYQLLGFEKSKNEIRSLGPIKNNIPVIILSSTEMEKIKPITTDWYTAQKQWLNKNPKSHIKILDATHFIQDKYPESICQAINSIIN